MLLTAKTPKYEGSFSGPLPCQKNENMKAAAAANHNGNMKAV
jgi:hypothetical protein